MNAKNLITKMISNTVLDQAMDQLGVLYVRYMDDFIILGKKCHRLKKMIKQVYQLLDRMRLKRALDKTIIGKVSSGFNFLGYWLSPNGITVAKTSQTKMQQKVKRLYD